MQKRGEISLEALVKFIPHFFLVVCLIAALFAVYKIALPKEKTTPAIDDLDRVVMNIEQLEPGEIAPVFTTTHGYIFNLYQKDLVKEGGYAGVVPKQCGEYTCLCVLDPDGRETCRKLDGITKPEINEKTKKLECPSGSYEQCMYLPMCFLKKMASVKIVNAGDSVYVCRSCTEIKISNNKAECLRHVQSI
ncbi:hypothetical protein KY338_00975 [Candidatus Woesearchaeota archaeon]|nr:hypothetical protein [Candidatus Woesearchaeota archaeon]MBW3006170.1 hypothetical protein [Candidatus Woesearchaeota archaeon]